MNRLGETEGRVGSARLERMATNPGVRAAARAKAAAEREAAARRRRRNRLIVIAAAVVVVVGGAGAVVTGSVASANAAATQAKHDAVSADRTAARSAAAGSTAPPPWALPADVTSAVSSAGLTMLTAEGTALHIHQHLTITVDGKPVTVPALMGIDERAGRISSLHTHDTSGILHVESPVVTTFHLDQAFAEWGVRLSPGAVGPYVDGKDGVRLTVFVNQKPYTGDPREIVLKSHEDIDFVVTTDGTTPVAPTAFRWPQGY